MPEYNDQQSRFAKAFEGYCTTTQTVCACGRTHFTSCDGHGDFCEGELEELQRKAAEEPDKYFEHFDFDTIDAAYIDGKQIVPDCPCGKYKRYCDWIEGNAESLAAYLIALFEQRRKDAARVAAESERLAAELARPA